MAIVKEERIGDQRLILGDCLEVMPGLDTFDAVVTDPPYGIGEGGDKNRSRGKVAPVGKYKSDKWDSTTADVQIKLAIHMSKSAIVFGGNYYDLAWTNLTKAVRRIYWRWHGMIRKGSDIRQHPTQKPLGVMEWCINHLPDTAQTILDPFMGSGTTLVACQKLGRAGTGIELDPDYFHIACKRVDEATRQPDLFVEPAPKPTQEVLL